MKICKQIPGNSAAVTWKMDEGKTEGRVKERRRMDDRSAAAELGRGTRERQKEEGRSLRSEEGRGTKRRTTGRYKDRRKTALAR